MSKVAEDFVHRLQQSQWLSADEIAANQRPLLERLVRHAATQTRFYPARLAPLFSGPDARSAQIDWSRWNEVSVLRRMDAYEHVKAMTATLVPRDSGEVREGESSGTTGRPLHHLRSTTAVRIANYHLQRIYELFDIDLNGSLAHIVLDKAQTCRYPAGGRRAGWNHHSPNAPLFMLDIGASAAEQLEWLQRVRPDHVMTYPETFREVAEAAIAQRSETRFRTFLSTGEVLNPEARDLIERAFGCRSVDIYGARELGPVAFQCPDGAGYHACAEAMLFELLDDNDRPVAPNSYGRVVVTSLHNFAMPFIRYDVGDYALAGGSPCPCGRGLPWVQEIAGRTRNMFVMPDGSKKRARGYMMANLPRFLRYKQIQLVQMDLRTLEVRYVPEAQASRPRLAKLTEFLRGEFHADLEVVLRPVERIERGRGMKLEQFISLLG